MPKRRPEHPRNRGYVDMAELADAPGSSPGGRKAVGVRTSLSIPIVRHEASDARSLAQCECGGTGRRTGFKPRRPLGHKGSTPFIRTNLERREGRAA